MNTSLEQIILLHLRASAPLSVESILNYALEQWTPSAPIENINTHILNKIAEMMAADKITVEDGSLYAWTGTH